MVDDQQRAAPSPSLRARDPRLLYITLAGLAAGVFAVDLFTPLGVAVWILYVVPLALTVLGPDDTAPMLGALGGTMLMIVTLFTDTPGLTPWIANVNRVCGIVVIWTISALARSIIQARNRIETEDWLHRAQTRLLEGMQGELSVAEIAKRSLAALSAAVDSPVGAFYVHNGTELRLTASHGLRAGADVPEVFSIGEGLVGEAARRLQVSVLTDLPSSPFAIRSALADRAPASIIVAPLVVEGNTHGVLELGLVHAPAQRGLDLIERGREGIAIAIRTASFRDRLRTLLGESQRQSEALRAQQEELRVTNEELEQQSEVLKSSQARLEQQQAELEATNAQLEAQAQRLEDQKHALSAAKTEAERASQYKSEFLANMSHELRTPLNSMLILAKLLSENKEARLTEEQVRYADTIYSSGNSLLALINDILDLSKIEAGAVELQPEPIAPRELVDALRRTFEPIATDKQLELVVDVHPETPESIVTDGQRLQQVLANLLSNALKFTERGRVMLRVSRSGESLAFDVHDTGPGIPPEQRETIFEAFRQADGSTHRRFGGTGLGLSISLELARLLGGDIRVTSEVGVGSTFTLIVPIRLTVKRTSAPPIASMPSHTRPPVAASAQMARVPAPASAPAFPDDRQRRRHPGRLILVIEDDPAFARLLYDLAHELEFDCVVAMTNDEGMALAREYSPNGILLDINLPDGSGLALLDRLKRNTDTRHIPVHIVSGTDNSQTALALGAVGYALKPVPREELVKAIHKLEEQLAQRVRRVLVVEDDDRLRASMTDLLTLDGVQIDPVGTAREALERLESQSFDCVVLDLNLPDANGYDVLEAISRNERYSFPPIIIYTGRSVSREEEERLRRFSKSVIIKGARSPERLLDEVTLFLHQVESKLPADSQRLLRAARERDQFFDGKTILLVEDDVRNVFALTSVFEPRGATVLVARNGREGILQVNARRPDLVLMDIMMPEMDGLSAIREIRQDHELRALPIIALTAKAMRDDYEECLAAGANDYLAKPLDVDKLISLCRVWMSR
jgi:signal transduction histidine kinase/CheY-like chemotaxis protein